MADTNNNNNEENKNEEKKEKTAAEMRKINKPLMEKKRRERINNCLNQLKMFLMDATKKDSSYYSKLEKADILEMTVKYLKNLQRQQLSVAMTSDPKVVHKYAAGYSQCANEVTRYLAKMDGFNPDLKNRLANHLSNSLNKIDTVIPAVGQPASSPLPLQLGQGHGHGQQPPLGLQMSVAGSGGIVVPQSQAADLQIGQLASAVMSSMASASASNSTVSSTTSAFPQLSQGPSAHNIFGNAAAMMSAASQQQPQPQPTAHAQAQGVPVLPVQLIPAKLPSGDLVYLMTNQSMPVTNVMAPMSIQIPGTGNTSGMTSGSLVSPVPAAQGTPTIQPALGAQPLPFGLSQLPSSSVITPSTSVAVVPPQVQDPKPSTSSGLPDTSTDSLKHKPMFPLFSFPPQDKPLDLGTGPSTSGLQVKTEKSDFSGAKPKTAPTATVTSSSLMVSDSKDSSRESSPSREDLPSPQQQGHQGHFQVQGHLAGPQQAAAAAANQVLPLPPGNIFNLQHDSMWRPW